MIEGITRTAIECFCLGLNKELMPFMASKEPSTLEAAIGLAITYEKRNNQRRDLYAEQESQSRTGLKCTFCHTIEAGAGSRSEERPPDKISERSNPEAPPVPAVPIATVTPVKDMGSNQCYHCRGFVPSGSHDSLPTSGNYVAAKARKLNLYLKVPSGSHDSLPTSGNYVAAKARKLNKYLKVPSGSHDSLPTSGNYVAAKARKLNKYLKVPAGSLDSLPTSGNHVAAKARKLNLYLMLLRYGNLKRDDMNCSLDLAGDDMNYSLDLAGDDMNYSLDLAGDDMNYSLDLAGDDMNCSLDLADDDLVLLRFRKIMTLIWNFSRFGIRIRDLLRAKFSLVDRRTWPGQFRSIPYKNEQMQNQLSEVIHGVMKTLKTQSCLQEKFDP
ncbi:hypothetical protein QAD02_008749 [Eretmocerus hayati]|uniref:Uncharacterized protein n=1 Tax=Eretmocerus hayati TaxID=131215 RepID=A0ACC2N7N5_9HYME|nr:hypothetical protein QAD02_008749 [Eretmocerus hayati]